MTGTVVDRELPHRGGRRSARADPRPGGQGIAAAGRQGRGRRVLPAGGVQPSWASWGCCRCRTRRSSAAAGSRPWSTCRCWRNWPAAGRRSRWAPACTCCPAAASPSSAPPSSGSGSCRRCSAAQRSAPTACRNRTPAPTPGRCGPGPSGTATEYVITGDKAWITHGPVADFMLVAARTGDDGVARDQHLPGARRRRRGQRRGAGTQDGLPGLADQRRCTSTACGWTPTGGSAPRVRASGSRWPRWTPAGSGSRPARSGWPRPRSTSPPTTPGSGPPSGGRSTSSRASRSCWPTRPPRSPRPGSCTCTRPAARTPASRSRPRRRWQS